MRILFAHIIAGTALIAMTATAHAQSVTKAQQDAIRANCRSDFMRNCSSVTPGGREALVCLEQNKAKLSAGCKSAVDAVSTAAAPKPAAPPAEAKPQPAPTPTTPAATAPAAMAPAAKPAPVAAAPVAPAPKKPAAKPVSAPKAAAAPARPAAPPPAAPATPTAVPAPGATPAAPKRQPTLGEAMLIRRFCGNDYRVLCKGTQIGGGRAIKCLADNGPSLSPGCRSAMANAGN